MYGKNGRIKKLTSNMYPATPCVQPSHNIQMRQCNQTHPPRYLSALLGKGQLATYKQSLSTNATKTACVFSLALIFSIMKIVNAFISVHKHTGCIAHNCLENKTRIISFSIKSNWQSQEQRLVNLKTVP